jgi:uncharacterized membrane protein YciS (DUF1049 family)
LVEIVIKRLKPWAQYIAIIAIFMAIFAVSVFLTSEKSYIYFFYNVAENLAGSADLVVVPA